MEHAETRSIGITRQRHQPASDFEVATLWRFWLRTTEWRIQYRNASFRIGTNAGPPKDRLARFESPLPIPQHVPRERLNPRARLLRGWNHCLNPQSAILLPSRPRVLRRIVPSNAETFGAE